MSAQVRRFLTNRNPRNLEKLCIARKPIGYHFEKNRHFRQFYYRIEFEKTNNHTSAFIRHIKEGMVLSASTKEFAIASRLHSNVDVSAAYNIGSVLARRCLQSGIQFVHRGLKDDELQGSERMQAFCRGVEEGGVLMKELPFYEPSYEVDTTYASAYDQVDQNKEFEVPK